MAGELDGAVEQGADGKYLIFWRAKCLVTGQEKKFKSLMPYFPMTFDVMKAFVDQFYRKLELLEYRPWNSQEDAHRILYPVPVQHVKFDVPKPSLAQPEPRRLSLLIQQPAKGLPAGASLLGGQSLLKGA